MRLTVLFALCLGSAALAADPSVYAGAEACKPCHPAEYTSQSTTSHARALAPSTPPQPGDWAFGAGLQAVTFVTRIDAESYREDGMTWYRSLNSYAITPGQHDAKGVVFRTFDPGARIFTCFACHSTGPLSVAKDEAVIPHELGVRCEVCHGPAAAHAKAPSQNRLRIPTQRVCAQCHRTDSETGEELTDLHDPRNARDQTLRLAASKCSLRSNGRLTCSTCHNPHQELNRDAASYNQRCQSCHATQAHRQPIANQACVTCHMPAIPVGPILTFANHRIAVYAPNNPIY